MIETTLISAPIGDAVNISDAQRDVRTAYFGGFAGQLAAGAIWFLSASAATWYSTKAAILLLVFGGMLIFPLTQLLLRLMGRPVSLAKGHPMNSLAMQVAFAVPLSLPLIGAASYCRVNWFYPAFMVAVGTHYLPFMFLYGMWQFGILGALLIAAGVVIGLYVPTLFSLGGWLTALLLFIFAFVGRSVVLREQCRNA